MFNRLTPQQFSQRRPNLAFWLALLVLNFLLFLPMFLLDSQSSALPPADNWRGDWWLALNKLLDWR